MASEYSSFIAEINEEIKHDKALKFLKKNQNTISWIIIIAIAIIVIHSSWYAKKRRQLEKSTIALYNEMYFPEVRDREGYKKSQAVLTNLIDNAPEEIVPVISLMKLGRDLTDGEMMQESTQKILELSENSSINVVWRDIATLMYVAARKEPVEKSIERLKPLTAEDRPFRFTAIEKLAMLYAIQKDFDRAIKLLEGIVDNHLAPKTMQKRINRVVNYLKNHKNDKESDRNAKTQDNSKEKTDGNSKTDNKIDKVNKSSEDTKDIQDTKDTKNTRSDKTVAKK